MTTLHDRLEDLAAAAPAGGGAAGDLWDRGVRRARVRRVGAVGAVVAAVALVAGVTAVGLRGQETPPEPADVPFEDRHLPTVVNAPGTWSDEEGPDGPLAAVGIAPRTRPLGPTDERWGLQLFGVSAVDGRSEWIDLPGVDEHEGDVVGSFAVSPDGQWLAWTRHRSTGRDDEQGALVGWAVMDTATREVRDLADPAGRVLRETGAELAFSGESRFLLVSSAPRGGPDRRDHRLLAFDVVDGSLTVLEKPGKYWLPNLGSAPSGAVWARAERVYRADPATGERSAISLPREVVTASWGPDDRAFAYIAWARPDGKGAWRLHAGRTVAEARGRVLSLDDVQPAQLLGWVDDRHVVVGRFRTSALVVDIVTGEVDKVEMKGAGEIYNAPLLASDLWQNPRVAPPDRDGLSDPRTPYLWGGGALLALVAGTAAVLVARRRRRA